MAKVIEKQDKNMTNMGNIYFIAGSKGGVGKSTVSVALIDLLQEKKENILLIESDTSNPDVWKMYKDEIQTALIDLDDPNGWIELVNICDEHKEASIVVNTAARNNRGVTTHGNILGSTLGELKRELVTFWVINRQRDSLELLNEFMGSIPESTIHVVRNGYFGNEEKFSLYNTSKIREKIEGRNGFSLNFPDLADRVSDDLYTKRLSISKASKELPIGNRAELERWKNEVKKTFGPLLK